MTLFATVRAVVCSATFLAAFASSVLAATYEPSSKEAQQLMAGYFGNTLICKAPGIFECHNWFKPDGTFIQFSWDSRPNIMVDGVMLSGVAGIEGKWWLEDEGSNFRLCRQLAPTAPKRCEAAVARKVGDTWSHPGNGNWPAEEFALVAGHK